jgi:hypothetical protein
MLREAIVDVDPIEAHEALSSYRKEKAKVKSKLVDIDWSTIHRAEISGAKREFLSAIRNIIESLREYWPLNLRQIHYQLLNEPPLIHASKPESRYRNSLASYKALCDLATRARHEGFIHYDVIDDPTRPVTVWRVYPNLSCYYGEQVNDILNDYWRDLMQSQPNHVEIVAEKNTLHNLLSPIAQEFCIPLTIGRGQCSTRPLYDISRRYQRSGKEALIIIAVADLDPDGDAIVRSIGSRLRDDFDVDDIRVVKAALTMKQVEDLSLPESYQRAKETSANYARYVRQYCTDAVYELEALPPETLKELVTDAIDSVIDHEPYNAEVDAEMDDAAHNAATRTVILETLKEQTGEP